nr:hypothetical protein [Geminisphaera colitermitum]
MRCHFGKPDVGDHAIALPSVRQCERISGTVGFDEQIPRRCQHAFVAIDPEDNVSRPLTRRVDEQGNVEVSLAAGILHVSINTQGDDDYSAEGDSGRREGKLLHHGQHGCIPCASASHFLFQAVWMASHQKGCVVFLKKKDAILRRTKNRELILLGNTNHPQDVYFPTLNHFLVSVPPFRFPRALRGVPDFNRRTAHRG